MKILMFGRGTINSLYGWAFEKSGHTVDFYVRPGRAAQYGSTVALDIRDGRVDPKGAPVREEWPVSLREELTADHDYDLIVVSVNHDQLSEAVAFLSARVGKATVLVFNNILNDPAVELAPIPHEQVVWGFPGGGGGFSGNKLSGGFVKAVFLGKYGDSNRTGRYRTVRDLFRKTGFSVVESSNFRNWLWFHFLVDAGLAARGLKTDGMAHVLTSRSELEQAILLMREALPLLKAKGGRGGLGGLIVSAAPAGLLSLAVQKYIGRGNDLPLFLIEQVEATAHGSREATSLYPRDVLAEARRLGVALPRLEALEPFFRQE
ncbi:ketopantoate reductase family protein [Sciscionella marina]|uniref:ketopantoate reductase family protein n=1 Tax=Sciscionella marina TaxID=508770 RepID=UPI00036B56B4|nr:2-dehydropantoate 2-reductase N-terminal domain-containing protein [Sciscionella marina]